MSIKDICFLVTGFMNRIHETMNFLTIQVKTDLCMGNNPYIYPERKPPAVLYFGTAGGANET